MKIYISGAITGTDDYMERFAKAEKKLTEQGYSVINPAKVNSQLPKDTTHEEYMNMSKCMLGMCDVIYLLNGWEKSCGANEEFHWAIQSRKIIMFERYEYPCQDQL